MIDLLQTVEYGGCSAKLPADKLDEIIRALNLSNCSELLVGTDTQDDAAVYKINDEQAIIFTTDFFPPVCSDPYSFGQIAAANALSDVYAMGGDVIMALNLIMFPSQKLPLSSLSDILRGGLDKVSEAGGLTVGGHTIDDFPPKYGLAVVGMVHPDKLITNANAEVDDVLILTKPLGTGIVMAGHRFGLATEQSLYSAIENMKQLNKNASEIMKKYNVKCATDITGFGFLGHALKTAMASAVHLQIFPNKVPALVNTIELLSNGCIPGASFRNQSFVEKNINKYITLPQITYEEKMLYFDAQTSGGMLIFVKPEKSEDMLSELQLTYPAASIVGRVTEHI
jgi:selenide,water dikinase